MRDPEARLKEILSREAGVPWAELDAVRRAIGDDAEMNRRMREEWRAAETRTQAGICAYYASSMTWLMQTYGGGWAALVGLARGEKPGLAAWAEEFVRMLPGPRATVLDYGGGFLKDSWPLAARGHRVVLAEIDGPVSRTVEAFCGEAGVAGVEVSPVRDENPPMGRHDGAVCFEVLEHVRDPVLLARRIVSSVSVGGPVALSASFGAPEHAPYHVAEAARWADRAAWEAELGTAGLEPSWADPHSTIRVWRRAR